MVHNYSRAIVIVGLLVALLLMPVVAYAAEVNIPASGLDPLGGPNVTNSWYRLGQRLFINGTVSKIGYDVRRVGNPTGNVTFSIYDVETDESLFSKVWGDASNLTTSNVSGYQVVTVNPPLALNQTVRLCVEYYGGNETDYCVSGYYSGDKITGQWYTNYLHDGNWHDIGEAEEGSYHLTYIPVDGPAPVPPNHEGIPRWVFGLMGCVPLGILVFLRKRKNK